MIIKGCIAVIVPAYNAEAHLVECLDSVLAQAEVGEVIVVDDGSTDGTGKLVRSYAESDDRVRVLSQVNSGVSAARNAGMGSVTMPFLAFVDADDIIPAGAFASLLAMAERCVADMTYGDFAMLQCGKVVPWTAEFAAFSSGPIPAYDVFASLVSVNRKSVSGSCWRILFRTSFLKKTLQQFPEGIAMSEDYCFILGCLMRTPAVAYVNETVYLVRREGGSTTQRYMPNLESSMDFVNERLREACEGDDNLLRLCWDDVANTSWAVCTNLYKEGAQCGPSARLGSIRRVMSKYHEAIFRMKILGDLGRSKALALKIGVLCPVLLWAALEERIRFQTCWNSGER